MFILFTLLLELLFLLLVSAAEHRGEFPEPTISYRRLQRQKYVVGDPIARQDDDEYEGEDVEEKVVIIVVDETDTLVFYIVYALCSPSLSLLCVCVCLCSTSLSLFSLLSLLSLTFSFS